MTNTAKLTAQAAQLKAENIAKHKANGAKSRIELHIFTGSGKFVEIKVVYSKESAESINVAAMALRHGSKSMADSYLNSVVEAI